MFSYYTCLEFDFFPEAIFYKKPFFLSRSISPAIRESRYTMKIGEYTFETNAMGCFGIFSVLHLFRKADSLIPMRPSNEKS
jgi:hypothetical protein